MSKLEASVRVVPRSHDGAGAAPHAPPYGDLSVLNQHREVLDALGAEALQLVAGDYMGLLGTSSAVYEINGDYALGILSSGWCRMLDAASREQCGTDDNREALASGKWLCHEECWAVSREAIELGEPVDRRCPGGIRLYAIPIRAGDRVVGAMNFGYGAPPQDAEELARIAERFGVAPEQLHEMAAESVPHSFELVALARQRLAGSARLVGEIVARRHAERELRRSNEQLRTLLDAASQLLATSSPELLLAALFERLAGVLGLEVYFNFLVTGDGSRLRLHASGGISPEQSAALEWLEFGQAVCGTVAQSQRPMVAEDVQHSTDPLTALIRSLGVTAYACQPLMFGSELIGTLSFGTRQRPSFRADELALMRTISDLVAVAFHRSRLEAAERAARAEAEAANAGKMRFLATMSHELRTPLNAIGGYVSLLEMGLRGPLTDEQREDLARIRRNQHHLMSLIADVLDFARLREGRQRLRTRSVKCDALLLEVRELILPQVDAAGHSLTLDVQESVPQLHADPERTRQILLNLLSNAVKFTPRGGRISMICDASGEGEHVRFRVCDNGIGIPGERLESVFEPFLQLESELIREREGVGLGLPISRELARAMGGDLTAESELGGGSTFTLLLPASL